MSDNLVVWISQLVIFIALIFILKKLYYEPVLKLLRRRESLTSGKLSEAEELKVKMAELKAGYEKQMSQLRDSFDQERRDALQQIRQQSEKKLSEARTKIEARLQHQRKDLTEEIKKLQALVPEWSEEIMNEITKAMTQSKVVIQ